MRAGFKQLGAAMAAGIGFWLLLPQAKGAEDAAARRPAKPGKGAWLAPTALAAAADGRSLYVAYAHGNSLAVFDIESRSVVRTIDLPGSPSGVILAADKQQLIVTCAAPESRVCLVDPTGGKTDTVLATGHTALAPVLTSDGRTLFVCLRFEDCVATIDWATRKETGRIPVAREPVAAALTLDGKYLLVANHLHTGRADADRVAASVSVLDVAQAKVVKELALPNGSGLLRDVKVSPDGRYAAVTHQIARFHLPTTQLERGWMNTSALTLIDAAKLEVMNTVLLDNIDSGAANPWAIGWSTDSATLCATHAGTHEISVIQVPALVAKLTKIATSPVPATVTDYSSASRTAADVPNDLAFLVGTRQRCQLGGRGPRALVLVGNQAWTASYFSDTLEVSDLSRSPLRPTVIPLAAPRNLTTVQRGEMWFNDATICFQTWQSCASCHSADARVDGIAWDLLNDGLGNPKRTKSLLWTHRTPPAMSMGVRETGETAVRAGIRHILFTVQPEEVALALDEYLKSLQPIPSPYLVRGKLSPAARRGQKLFQDSKVGCAKCHPPGLFTDLRAYDVGTRGLYDKEADQFDTPTLVELWRTAPFLHSGAAATVRDVLTSANPKDLHGKTSFLTKDQIEDLAAYLLSL